MLEDDETGEIVNIESERGDVVQIYLNSRAQAAGQTGVPLKRVETDQWKHQHKNHPHD
jgi:hypothetical protein